MRQRVHERVRSTAAHTSVVSAILDTLFRFVWIDSFRDSVTVNIFLSQEVIAPVLGSLYSKFPCESPLQRNPSFVELSDYRIQLKRKTSRAYNRAGNRVSRQGLLGASPSMCR